MYHTLAYYYDRLMAHVDYEEWVEFALARLGLPPHAPENSPTILDLACGTGNTAVSLALRGYRVIGIDKSPEMLSVAEQKARDADVNLTLIEQDMTTFQLDEPVDACVCLFDSLNYLTEDGALKATFVRVSDALRPGAPFVFDLHTEYRFHDYGNSIFAADEGDAAYIWESEYDPQRRLCFMHVSLFVAQDLEAEPPIYRRFDEVHVERAFTDDEIDEALAAANFKLLARMGELTTEPPQPDEDRVFYVVKRQ